LPARGTGVEQISPKYKNKLKMYQKRTDTIHLPPPPEPFARKIEEYYYYDWETLDLKVRQLTYE
jgi:hypothetical protein